MKHVHDVSSLLQNMSLRRTIHDLGTVDSHGPNERSGVLSFSLSGREKKKNNNRTPDHQWPRKNAMYVISAGFIAFHV